MGFEDAIFRKIDRQREHREELSPSMERAYRQALMTLRHPTYAIRESDFESVYGPAAVRADKSRALHERSLHDQRDMADPKKLLSYKMAQVFEAVVLDESAKAGWLGENATTLKTSDYDDFVNKIDMIAEWHRPGEGTQVAAIGVDATFGTTGLTKKFKEMREGIETGKLASLRYFKDTRGDYTGTRNNISRTIVGVSQPVVEELANHWINGRSEELANHPAQRVIAIQMRAQLEAGLKLAERVGQAAAASSMRNLLAVIAPIEQSKRHLRLGSLIDDPVAREISRHTHELSEN